MLTDWTKGTTEDKENLENLVRKSQAVLRRLNEICEMKIKELEDGSGVDQYNSPSWAYRAADKEGYKRALRYIQLLTKEERK